MSDVPTFVALIRRRFTPMRVETTWIGEERTVDKTNRTTLAAIVGAKDNRLRASKKIIDTKHELYTACTAIRSQARQFMKANSRAFDASIRLVVNDEVSVVHNKIMELGAQLDGAAMRLQNGFVDVVKRDDLGKLYSKEDYAKFIANVAAQFSLRPTYPSIDPPPALADVSDAAASYAIQCANARIAGSLQLAEQEFASEFQKLVSHFVEMMGFDENGNPRRFQEATLNNLNEFFARFRRFDIGSSPALNAAVDEAAAALSDTTHSDLINSERLRGVVGRELGRVSQQLSRLVVESDVERAFELD